MQDMFTRAGRGIALLCAIGITLGADQPSDSKKLDDILNQLHQINALLNRTMNVPQQEAGTTKPRTITVDVRNARYLGSKDAPLAIVGFTDYECPFCQRFHQETFADLKNKYIDTGKVRFYSMDFPLASHHNAMTAANAGRCADEQGMFWIMHDQMQNSRRPPELSTVVAHAEELHLDVERFRKCVESHRYENVIRDGVAAAMRKDIRGTPTFVIGKVSPSGADVEGELLVGALPFEAFETKLMTTEQ